MDNRSSVHSTFFPFHRYKYLLHLSLILLSCHAALVYGQSQGISMIIDDTDSGIEYSSGWVPLSGNRNEASDGTEHLSRLQGGTAIFTFIGIGISVFGTIVPQSAFGGNITKSTYFLDDEPGQSYTVSASITEVSFRVPFFQSLNLRNGTHTLMIVNDNEDDWYFLDFLQVLSPDPSQSPNNLTFPQPVSQGTAFPSSASASRSSPGSLTMNSSSRLAATRTSSLSSMMSTSTNDGNTLAPSLLATHEQPISPGAAVGIAFSGAVVLAIAAALIVIICHRRRRRNTELARLTAIDPFVEGFIAVTHDHEPKPGEFSPPVSPAAVETSAHGMLYPYFVEFFSRSRGPRSFKSIVSPSKKSARSAKLNVSPMTQSDLPSAPPLIPPPLPSSSHHSPPVLWTLPTQRPVLTVRTPKRKSTRRSTKFSFLNNLGVGHVEQEIVSPISSTEVQMGVAL